MLRRLNVARLKIPEVAEAFWKELEYTITNAIADADADPKERWTKLQEVLRATASQHLGPLKRKHQDWFDESDKKIQDLLTEKHQTFMVYQNDPASESKKAAFANAKGKVQKELRQMQDAWYGAKAEEIQSYADQNDSKRFYESLKTVYGPKCATLLPLLSSDGSLLVNRKQVLDSWVEHFEGVLNRPSIINDEAIDRLPQIDINENLARPITEEEVKGAIHRTSSGKAPGSDGIPTEVFKCGGHALIRELTELFQSIWDTEQIPQRLKNASIVRIYK
ncbi:uncharacterized protein LOC106478008, partial [Limulus polyphemus]|uniref:Uncharacterized protein LOC106478008 n=1 Tax=Limulus polyphemus TaxID=6850 RepID=A0ABM1C4G4_LIMPO